MPSDEKRDALARVIDPDSWDLHDARMKVDKAREILVKDSRVVAERVMQSGILASLTWDRREYYNAVARVKRCTSKTGRCYSVEDLLDGYFVHDPKCSRWPDGAIGGTGCIR